MFELLSLNYDDRIKAYSILARLSYGDYLALKNEGHSKLHIQRGIVKDAKAYETLKEDLKRGCLMPPIAIATDEYKLSVPKGIIGNLKKEKEFLDGIQKNLLKTLKNKFSILDGQQRTRALEQVSHELQKTKKEDFLENYLRIEIWTNLSFGGLAYRMLLLNAGQKPMSIKHQIEVLEHRFEKEIRERIPKIEISTSLEGGSNKEIGTFRLSSLAQGLYAWLQKTPHLDLRSEILDRLSPENAITNLSSKDVRKDLNIEQYLSLVELIYSIDKICQDKEVHSFLNSDTIIQSWAAAASAIDDFSKIERHIKKILSEYKKSPKSDYLGIKSFYELKPQIDPTLFNVGTGTRDWAYSVFLSYFDDLGKNFNQLWAKELKALVSEKTR